MQLLILLLLVAALALLVLALVSANSALAACSIALSLIAVAAIVRGRGRRAELAQARRAEAERQAKLAADQDEATRVLAAAAAAASRRAAAAPAQPAAERLDQVAGVEPAVPPEQLAADEPAAAETIAPLERHGQARVWVIDGRPRYHLTECRQLDGSAEPISLAQAVADGFTPCADCDPDNRITG
ncbi:MAG: hypothetical protein ACJ74U_03105 [Jatrophihabitantaceae bacterium]